MMKETLACCALPLVLALAAHGGAPVKRMNRLQEGTWGGRHVRLDVGPRGARVEFDCAHGTLEGPVTLDRNRRFDVRGTYTRERGGPTRVEPDAPDGQVPPDEGAETFRARYTGRVRGKTLSLTVTRLDSGEKLGTFSLAHGEPPVLTKCL